MSIKKQLSHLRYGDISEAFEAAKDLSDRSHPPVKDIIAVLNEAKNAHNREAAAYALSWVDGRRNQEPLQALLATFNKAEEYPTVRAQALEGFGLHRPTKRNRLWSRVEAAILRGLIDESVEIRFWACYAAGTLRVKTALPTLRRLATTDVEICPNWWRVSEEAADAIEWIHGRETPPRLRISQHSEE
jgi:HEAT repeat protein